MPKQRDLSNVTSPTVATVFVAVGNTDTTEGRGAPTVEAVCLSRAGAEFAGKGRGVYGGDAHVVEHRALLMPGGDVFLLKDAHRLVADDPVVQLREAGLAKLTPAERRALGL